MKRYKKSKAVIELEALAMIGVRKKYPGTPERYFAPRTFEDKTANGLTKCVIEFLRMNGQQAERISSTGRYVDNKKLVTDVMGGQRQIGSGKWIPGSMQKGTADISATIQGRSVKIEIKINDKQSIEQKRYQEQIEQAGGIYIIARSFEEFRTWYEGFINNLK